MRESLACTIESPRGQKHVSTAPASRWASGAGNRPGKRLDRPAARRKVPQPGPRARRRGPAPPRPVRATPEQTDTGSAPSGRIPKVYARRIPVQPSCTACHGANDERPDFVEKGSPDDRTCGFEPGDLRDIYSVFGSAAEPAEGSGNMRSVVTSKYR
ncbi:MAG: DUF3365 domain-containing protein [Salinivenus sp.]